MPLNEADTCRPSACIAQAGRYIVLRRPATGMEEQARLQSKLRDAGRHQRKLRQEIFDVEDRILAKRDERVQAIKSGLKPAVTSQTLFAIRRRIVAPGVKGTVAG